MKRTIQEAHPYPEVGVPLFWPFGLALGIEEAALQTATKSLQFFGEVEKTQVVREPPQWTTDNRIALDLYTMALRDFSRAKSGAPVLVLCPYAGHASTIADFQAGQSLIETLLDNGCSRVFATDWRSATPEMRFYNVGNYLADIDLCVSELGDSVCLVGLCQGGWCAAMYAARFPKKVARLVIAGAPIDTDAGDGAIKWAAHTLPMRFYEDLVRLGDGLMKGTFMLEGFKNLHPITQYFDKFVDLYEHLDDPSYVTRFECFERWYEYTIDLPGTWYLQVIEQLFKQNRLARGDFVALGKKLELRNVRCPAYLLAGENDYITPKEQVFAAQSLLGTEPDGILTAIAKAGHIGLFMGQKALRENWVPIAHWMSEDH
ncbi:poly(3-hydroxybutyrate) depolymerase [Paraburkholderia sp. WC7.3g]|uniref:alpha/beta fold hydrolase n=1 Tax=Paraburkholderia sp. WC7.3g TaxID=2991070 RepID=UPI003D2538BC